MKVSRWLGAGWALAGRWQLGARAKVQKCCNSMKQSLQYDTSQNCIWFKFAIFALSRSQHHHEHPQRLHSQPQFFSVLVCWCVGVLVCWCFPLSSVVSPFPIFPLPIPPTPKALVLTKTKNKKQISLPFPNQICLIYFCHVNSTCFNYNCHGNSNGLVHRRRCCWLFHSVYTRKATQEFRGDAPWRTHEVGRCQQVRSLTGA